MRFSVTMFDGPGVVSTLALTTILHVAANNRSNRFKYIYVRLSPDAKCAPTNVQTVSLLVAVATRFNCTKCGVTPFKCKTVYLYRHLTLFR